MSTGATAVVGRGLVKATWRLPSEGFRRGGSGGGGGSGEGSSCPGVVSGAMLLVVSSSSRRRRALSCCRLGAYCKPALSCVMWLRPTDTLVPFGMGLSDFDLVSDWKLISDSVGVDRVDVDRRDGLVVEGNSRSGQEEVWCPILMTAVATADSSAAKGSRAKHPPVICSNALGRPRYKPLSPLRMATPARQSAASPAEPTCRCDPPITVLHHYTQSRQTCPTASHRRVVQHITANSTSLSFPHPHLEQVLLSSFSLFYSRPMLPLPLLDQATTPPTTHHLGIPKTPKRWPTTGL